MAKISKKTKNPTPLADAFEPAPINQNDHEALRRYVANRLRGVYWPGGARSAFGPFASPGPHQSWTWKTKELLRSIHAYACHR